MKDLRLGILLSVIAGGLVACSSKPAEETAPASSTSAAPEPAPKPEPAPAPAPAKMVSVPAGTEIEISLVTALGSATSNAGDKFEASLASPLAVGGTTVLDKGAKVHGQVIDAKGSGRVKGLASITLSLTDVVENGKSTAITTKDWTDQAESSKGRDAKIIGGVAAIGTAIGAIAGGKKGAAEGAAVGAGAGTGTVLVTKGKEVELGPETKIKFTLDKSVQLAARK